MTDRLMILIVGGYGTFGGRIVELLATEPNLTLIVAGRSAAAAQQYCQSRGTTAARLIPAAFDRSSDLASQLAAYRPDVLVDASGPFQAYGDTRYRVIEACIAGRVNYLDLADGSDFVAGVTRYDAIARSAGLFALSGVSSFPVLTAAVVRRLATGMDRVERIAGGIAPSPFAGVGPNVVKAIAGYAGQPVRVKDQAGFRKGFPFTEQRRLTIGPPGFRPLRSTMFSLVDVPDLRVLAELWPDADSIWMGAGPVPEVLHRALIALAWLVRIKLIRSLSFLAPVMHVATNRLRWGEHRGGMFVAVVGTDVNGTPMRRAWHLLAEGNDGPLIPSMAVQAVVRRILDGRGPDPGARAAVHDLELGDYESLFSGRTIHTGVWDGTDHGDAPLYGRILGAAFQALPAELKTMHDVRGNKLARGRARVERGHGVLARAVAWAFGFPQAAADTPVMVRFQVEYGTETWTRTFGDKNFSSRQYAGTGRSEGLLCECFGPMTFAMALVLDGRRLSLVLRRWSVFGVPLPMWLCPRSEAYEQVEDGKFRFDVEIGHRLLGRVVRYRGWLET